MRAPALILVVALVATSCGGDDGGSRAAPAPPATTVETATTSATSAPVTSPPPITVPVPAVVRYASPYPSLASARDLALDLAEAETTVRDASKSPDERARAGRRQQVRLRQLADAPAWDAGVQAALPVGLREPTRRNAEAGRLLLSMFKTFPDALPPWEIVDPATPTDLLRYYKEAQAALGIDWTYLAAINLVETRMGRIRGASTAGARGPMQFIPSSWASFGAGGNIEDDRDSIFAAARHLVASGRKPFDIDKALYGYNHSDAYVKAVKSYASVLQAEPQAYAGYHAWQAFYRTPIGDFLLPKGYKETSRIPMSEYATRPITLITP